MDLIYKLYTHTVLGAKFHDNLSSRSTFYNHLQKLVTDEQKDSDVYKVGALPKNYQST